MTHTFHIRDGMKWSDGEPATCEDARIHVPDSSSTPSPDDGYLGSGYLDAVPDQRRVSRRSTCEDQRTSSPRRSSRRPSSRRPTSRSCRSTSGRSTRWRRSSDTNPRATSTTSRPSSAPARTSRRMGARQVHPHGPEPQLLGHRRASPTRSSSSSSRRTDTMVQALRNGELDYVRGIGADLFDALDDRAEHPHRRGLRQRLHVPVVQHPRQHSDGYKRLDVGAGGPGVPRRAQDRRSTARNWSTRCSTATVSPGTTHVPPYHVNWHVEPTNPRDFDIDAANSQARRRRLPSGADGNPRRQGRQADQSCA